MSKASRRARVWAACVLAIFCSPLVPAQTIEVFAGGRFFQNVPATTIQLGPRQLAFGPDGMLYITDSVGALFRYNPALGTVSSLPGIPGRGNFNFGYYASLAFDPSGHLLVTNGSDLIYVDDAGGTTVIGPLPQAGQMQFRNDGILVYASPDDNRVRARLPSGDIIVIAGQGAPGYAGDGGNVQLSTVNSPYSIANDAAGNLYIADTQNSRVRKVDAATAVITTYAGTGIATSYNGDGQLATDTHVAYPLSVAIGPDGHLYIAAQSRIVKVDSATHRVTTIAGGSGGFSGDGGPATSAQISTPFSMVFAPNGDLYFTDQYRVRKISAATGIIDTVVGNGEYVFCGEGVPARSACLTSAYGIDVDSQQNVVFSGDAISRIRQVSASTGLVTTVASLPTNTSGRGVEHDAAGNLYVASFSDFIYRIDATTHAVTTIAGTGAHGLSGDGGPATSAILAAPSDVAVDATGNIYIADSGNWRVRRIDATTGVMTTYAGRFNGTPNGDGGPATAANIGNVSVIQFDPSGNLVMSTGLDCRLRRVDAATGIITTIAGNGTCTSGTAGDGGLATAASLGVYTGFTFDAAGNIYLAYASNIRRVDAVTGIITTVTPPAGGWKAEGLGIQDPWALEFDALGNLYVGDRFQKVLFRISGL
jgi:trimeric autotransporter adhesin